MNQRVNKAVLPPAAMRPNLKDRHRSESTDTRIAAQPATRYIAADAGQTLRGHRHPRHLLRR